MCIHIYVYIYIYIYITEAPLYGQLSFNEAQKCPSGEVPLVFVPVGTPGAHPNETLLGPNKAPKGTNTKVTSAKGHFSACPTHEVRQQASQSERLVELIVSLRLLLSLSSSLLLVVVVLSLLVVVTSLL